VYVNIYVLDLFDGGGGMKPPKPLLESTTVINFKLNLFIVDCQVLVWGYSVDINYDRGDNLPHDQIKCHVTEAKKKCIKDFCLVLTNYNSRYLRKIFLYINHNHMEYFYKPWSITKKSKYWGMQTHKKRPGRVAVPEKFYCINFVYLHRPPTCI
jgi:hypothetical protein